MSARRSFATRLTVALIAAYVLVLQGLLGGVLAGQHAGLLALDQAIHLAACDPGGSGPSQSSDDQRPAHLPDCCAQGCQSAAAGPGPAMAAAIAFAYPNADLAPPALPARQPGAESWPERSPASPRGPPARA